MQLLWEKMRPKHATVIPPHWIGDNNSFPSKKPAKAVTIGIIAIKILDLATPRCFIDAAHNEKAILEQNTERNNIERITFQER